MDNHGTSLMNRALQYKIIWEGNMEIKNEKREWIKLKVSVYFGWIIIGLIPIFSITWWLIDPMDYSFGEYLYLTLMCALIILCIRYSMIKPVQLAGAALAGILTVSIIELLSRGRVTEQSIIVSGILIMLMLLLVLIRGMILSLFYLSRESYHYFKYKERYTTLNAVKVISTHMR
jgi:hypothetical protein